MNRVLVEDGFRTILDGLRAQTEFCDRDGNVLGYYIPAENPHQDLSAWVRTRISDEELERRAREPGGLSTEDVLRRLRELETR